jgi:L-arabinokinase
MGGLTEYTGSLVVGKTSGAQTCVAAQRSRESELTVDLSAAVALDGQPPTVIPTNTLRDSSGSWVTAERWLQGGGADQSMTVHVVVGAVVELLRAAGVSSLEGGLSVAVGSTTQVTAGTGREAALVSATLLAVSAALDRPVDAHSSIALCQRVLNEWLGRPVGIGDGACVILGEAGALMQWRGDVAAPIDTLALPESLTVIGIDCGLVHPEADLKYARVRTASFMGRALIDRIVKHDGGGNPQWDGHLARVSVPDYVERFRDRIPTKLKGSEFLDRFGETGDPLTRIEPSFVYKIRSRTEHQIYEHARACAFVECLARAVRNRDEQALHDAGALMYASHWSYGQRCGLGSVATDALVRLIREHAVEAGVYGAKISAGGCGGAVVVLMRAGARESAALDAVMEQYRSETGNAPVLCSGSQPGALISGVQRV